MPRFIVTKGYSVRYDAELVVDAETEDEAIEAFDQALLEGMIEYEEDGFWGGHDNWEEIREVDEKDYPLTLGEEE